jgi:hypothetical protein
MSIEPVDLMVVGSGQGGIPLAVDFAPTLERIAYRGISMAVLCNGWSRITRRDGVSALINQFISKIIYYAA